MDARWIALSIAVVLNAAANILIKAAARGVEIQLDLPGLVRLATEPYLAVGIASFAAALGFYAYALTGIELSVGYPIMTSLGLVIVFLWSVMFFQERLDWVKVVGTASILVGVVMLARPA